MVKPPVVYIAGLLRAPRPRHRHRRLDLALPSWPASCSSDPPNVSGWDDDALARHLDASAAAGSRRQRARRADVVDADGDLQHDARAPDEGGAQGARASGAIPAISARHARALERFADARSRRVATDDWQQSAYRALRQNALRHADRHLPRHADLLS